MKNNEILLTKPEKLSQIIYDAILRYTKIKRTQIKDKMTISGLDFSSVPRGNSNHKIDVSENNNDSGK